MKILKSEKLNPIDFLIQFLDSFRVYLLRFFLKLRLLRHLYRQTHWRLGVGMLVSTAFYLPMAFYKPHLLLAIGPLVFGYPHLVTSYRFTSKERFFGSLRKYHFFILMTILAVILHVSHASFPGVDQLPFGVWQIVVATFALNVTVLLSRPFQFKQIIISFLICSVLIKLAWAEPIMYVGGALIIHNWVAFIYWILHSTTKARKMVAVICSFIFLIIHVLVLSGQLDFFIPVKDGMLQFQGTSEATGWYLASWSSDPVVWYRLLVLYTFGLSLHYFVWLRAIPESINKFEHPHSLRLTFKKLRQDLGEKSLYFTIFILLAGTLIWILSFPLGSTIYFEIAILHGSLELIFLSRKLS